MFQSSCAKCVSFLYASLFQQLAYSCQDGGVGAATGSQSEGCSHHECALKRPQCGAIVAPLECNVVLGNNKKGQVSRSWCNTTTTTRCTYCSQHCLHSISGNLRLLCGCRLCCLKAMATGYEFGHRANGAPVLALCTAYVDAHKRVSCRRRLCCVSSPWRKSTHLLQR